MNAEPQTESPASGQRFWINQEIESKLSAIEELRQQIRDSPRQFEEDHDFIESCRERIADLQDEITELENQ